MATRKTGSRQIVVDGIAYRWRIRRQATSMQADYGTRRLHVAVERADNPGALLVLFTDRPHPHDWSTIHAAPVLPPDVARWIRQTLQTGGESDAG